MSKPSKYTTSIQLFILVRTGLKYKYGTYPVVYRNKTIQNNCYC